MKIKVAFLTGEYPPMQGGIADHIACLADHMAPLKVDSSILISRRWQQENSKGNAATSQSLISPHPIHAVLPNWGWRCWPAITKFLTANRPNILHIQYQAAAFDLGGWVNWLPWYLKKRGINTRLVTTFHDLRIPYIFPKAGPLRWKSILALARYSDAVICTNREDLHKLSNTNYKLSKERLPASLSANLQSPLLAHIPLGSNVEPQPPANFDRKTWRAKYQVHDGTMFLAYFGFLNESKGGEELIEAVALLHQQGIDVHLLLIGGDVGHADPTNIAYAQKVQALIEQHALTDFVHRTGYVELPQVSANLLAADAVVMPYRDGVSFRRTTLIAALRHGCAIISTAPTDPTLIPEIQPGENMLLAQPNDPVSLAQTIAPLTNANTLRTQLSRGAKTLGELFEWEKIADQTAMLYRKLTHGRHSQLTIDNT